MSNIYTIVKKNSTDHQAAVASHTVSGEQILPVGSKHVMIPSKRSVSFGHNVSHAKNRTSRRRMPNLNTIHYSMENGENKAIRLSSRDHRTYKKLTAVEA